MMTDLKIPALIIHLIKLKEISALKDLGLELTIDAEIDRDSCLPVCCAPLWDLFQEQKLSRPK